MSVAIKLSSAFFHAYGEEPKNIPLQDCKVIGGYGDYIIGYADSLSKQLGFRATNHYCNSINKDYTVVDFELNVNSEKVLNLKHMSNERFDMLFNHINQRFPEIAKRVREINLGSRIKDLSLALCFHPQLLDFMFAAWSDIDLIFHAVRPEYPDGRPRALQVASFPNERLDRIKVTKASCRLDPEAKIVL